MEYAEEVGLKLLRPPFIPCSLPALEAAEYAREQGKFDQYHLAVFKAYWEEAKNIGFRDVLLQVAQDSGLDVKEVESCLDSGRYAKLVKQHSEEAKQSGIGGIPSYIIGDHLLEGAQPYPVFQRAVESMGIKRKLE